MPRGEIYGGERHRITLTVKAEEIVKPLVGQGKRFARLSDLVNYLVEVGFGSEKQKDERKQMQVTHELSRLSEDLAKLRKKHPDAEPRASILSHFYQMPVSLELATKAQSEWEKHVDSCISCSDQGLCPKANKVEACWRSVSDKKRKAATFNSPTEILHSIANALQIADLEKKINQFSLPDFSVEGTDNERSIAQQAN